jgi:hypothetical protein
MVPDYVYIGLKLHCSGNFSVAINDLAMKGKKALCKMKTLYIIPLQNKLKTSLKLLDTLIMPVLTYCSEIWGHQLIKEPNNCVKLLHTKFCKQIL